MDTVTMETKFVGRSGSDIVIHRYGQDDYSAWFTDDVTKDTHGYSVRGSLIDIMEEVRDELPARRVMSNSERLETLCVFVDMFEDFLEEKGIDIPNPERDEDPCGSLIYGTDFANLSDRIEHLLIRYGVLKGE